MRAVSASSMFAEENFRSGIGVVVAQGEVLVLEALAEWRDPFGGSEVRRHLSSISKGVDEGEAVGGAGWAVGADRAALAEEASSVPVSGSQAVR